MAFRRTIARLNRVYRLSERHIAPGYEHKVKDVMDNIKREVVNQPGLINIEVLTEKNKPDIYYALTCWEKTKKLWINSYRQTYATTFMSTWIPSSKGP